MPSSLTDKFHISPLEIDGTTLREYLHVLQNLACNKNKAKLSINSTRVWQCHSTRRYQWRNLCDGAAKPKLFSSHATFCRTCRRRLSREVVKLFVRHTTRLLLLLLLQSVTQYDRSFAHYEFTRSRITYGHFCSATK